MKESMHEEIIGSGVANLFIAQMKLEGWLPVEEYFKMKKLGIDLDWVMVLTMENDGFIAIPMVAEYCVPHKDSGLKSGWYKDEIGNPNMRIDDWTNVIMFKPIETRIIAEKIRTELFNECKEKENIEDVVNFEKAFTESLIKLCKGIK